MPQSGSVPQVEQTSEKEDCVPGCKAVAGALAVRVVPNFNGQNESGDEPRLVQRRLSASPSRKGPGGLIESKVKSGQGSESATAIYCATATEGTYTNGFFMRLKISIADSDGVSLADIDPTREARFVRWFSSSKVFLKVRRFRANGL